MITTPEGVKMEFTKEKVVDGKYQYELHITPPADMSITEALIIAEHYTNQYVISRGATEPIELELPREG